MNLDTCDISISMLEWLPYLLAFHGHACPANYNMIL